MFRRQTKIIGLIVLATLMLTGCSANDIGSKNITPSQDNKIVATPIKIGFVGPLSGDAANIGLNMQAAVELAQEELNQKGGINGRQIQVVFEDGKCDSKQANTAGNKLISVDKIQYIIGGTCSGETLAVAPLAEKDKVVLLSPASTNPDITKAGDYIFRLIPSDSFQGKFAAEYLYNKGINNVAVLYTNNTWASGVKQVFIDNFKKLGGQVSVEESIEIQARDARSQLTKVKNSAAQAIYLPTQVENGIVILKQTKELGLKQEIFGGDLWDDVQIAQKAGAAAEGAKFTVAATKQLPTDFLSKMKQKKNGDNVNVYAPRAYDALYIFAKIIGQAGTDSNNVKTALYQLNYQGIAGDYSFDANGDLLLGSFAVKQFKDGKIVEVK